MGPEIFYIYTTSYSPVNQFHTKSAVFLRKNTMITNVIYFFLQQFKKQEVNKETYVLDTIFLVFALFRQQK